MHIYFFVLNFLNSHLIQQKNQMISMRANENNNSMKIQQLNQDIALHYQLCRNDKKQNKYSIKSMGQLSELLKHRNARFNNTRQKKERILQENKMKGINIKQLEEKVKTLRNYNTQVNEKKKNEKDCYFYLEKVDRTNQDEYITKNIEYSMFNVVQTFMYDKNYRESQSRKLINKLMKGKDSSTKRSLYARSPAQPRSQQKKNLYIKTLKSLLWNFTLTENRLLRGDFQIQNNENEEKNLERVNFIGGFANTFRSKFWHILNQQLIEAKSFCQKKSTNMKPCSFTSNNQKFKVQLAISSLKQVQMEYNKVLPTNFQNIQNYLWNIYLNKLSKQSQTEQKDHQKELVWGIAYLLYRAGRKEAFYQVLNGSRRVDLFNQFAQYDDSIQNHNPEPSPNFWTEYSTDDVFYNQLIFVLKGDPKFSSNVICDPNTLDIVWIILRTLGLYIDHQQARQKFLELRKDLLRSYLESSITETKISNMLYLLNYNDLTELCPNSYIDKDDLVHYLIALTYNPNLIRDQESAVRRKLTTALHQYVLQLITEKRSEYIYYMLLIPIQNFVHEASEIISMSHKVREIDWNFFRQRLSQEKFQELVRSTLEKYLNFSGDHILVANMYQQLLKDTRAAINVVLQLLINSIVRCKVQAQSVDKAQKMVLRLMESDYILSKQHNPLFTLLSETRRLWSFLSRRQVNQIVRLVANTEFLIRGNSISKQIQEALEALIDKSSLDAYFYFLQYVTRGMQLAIMKKEDEARPQALEKIYRDVSNSLETVLDQEACRPYGRKQIVVNLRNHLIAALNEQPRH